MKMWDDLLRQARQWEDGRLTDAEREVQRQMTICNGCRYCEGFCAVFPAMTRRLSFAQADIHYMANLCHNCGACLHACQYAPPHEFAINVPRAMAQVRQETYSSFAWPAWGGKLYQRQGLFLSLALVLGLTLFIAITLAAHGTLWFVAGPGHFYEVLPHNAMVMWFAPVFLWMCLALTLGALRFWRAITAATSGAALSSPASQEALHAALTLKYLDGGHGEGCHNEDDAWTHARRRAHHLTFYGFMLCFAATSVATLYHYLLDWVAPYDFSSLPKWLGTTGGLMLMTGTAWLWRLNQRRHVLHREPGQSVMDRGFVALLFLTALTGLALMLSRGTVLMPSLLALHLGTVMALFITMPYGKFAHGVYRMVALLRFAVEKRQPNRLGLGGE